MKLKSNDSLAEGHRLAELAAKKAGEDWQAAAYKAFIDFAKQYPRFTTEQVRFANPGIICDGDTRAWGAIARRAAANEAVQALGWTRSIVCHGRPVTEWASLIHASWGQAE